MIRRMGRYVKVLSTRETTELVTVLVCKLFGHSCFGARSDGLRVLLELKSHIGHTAIEGCRLLLSSSSSSQVFVSATSSTVPFVYATPFFFFFFYFGTDVAPLSDVYVGARLGVYLPPLQALPAQHSRISFYVFVSSPPAATCSKITRKTHADQARKIFREARNLALLIRHLSKPGP